MKQKVSVIIPFYSHKEWLEEALESVFAQVYDNLEVILINDGSVEDISDLTECYGDKITYIEQENKGAAAARNRGIEEATGEYIAFLDADDIWTPEKLETQIEAMKRAGAKWSHMSYVTFGDVKASNIDLSWFQGKVYPKVLARNPIATPCVVIESSILKQDRGLRFNEKYRYGEDNYLWVKLARQYELCLVEKPLVKVRIHGNNASKSVFAQLEAREQAYKAIKRGEYASLPFSYKTCSTLCHIAYNATKKGALHSGTLAKILYAPGWLGFRILAKKM